MKVQNPAKIEQLVPLKHKSNWCQEDSANQLSIEHINVCVHASIQGSLGENLHDHIYKPNEKSDRIDLRILHDLCWVRAEGKDGIGGYI